MNLVSCNYCNGSGTTVGSDHVPQCNGPSCEETCPIEVEIQCEYCKGTGLIEGSVDIV